MSETLLGIYSQEVQADQTLPLGRIGNPCSMDHPKNQPLCLVDWTSRVLKLCNKMAMLWLIRSMLSNWVPRFAYICLMLSLFGWDFVSNMRFPTGVIILTLITWCFTYKAIIAFFFYLSESADACGRTFCRKYTQIFGGVLP